MIRIVFCALLLVLSALCLNASSAEPFQVERKAVDFDRVLLANPALMDKIKASGNLAGRVNPTDQHFMNGWFEYDFNVPAEGWYELLVQPGCDNHIYTIDKATRIFGQSNSDKVGNIWLTVGKHTVRIERYYWTGFSPITSLTLNKATDVLEQNMRIEMTNQSNVVRKGQNIEIDIWTAGLSSPQTINVWTHDRTGKIPRIDSTLELPASAGHTKHHFAIGCQNEGIFNISFGHSGKSFARRDIPPLTAVVIDAAPVARGGGDLKKTLVSEIDCAATEPNYMGGSATRVTKKSFGSYREGGDNGWLQHHNSTDPGWFAYKFKVPAAQQLYCVEYDYPDDMLRTFAAAIREGRPGTYHIAAGVDCGGEYTLSNSMLTQSIMFYPLTTDLRFIAISPKDGSRAAVSKIRLYAVDANLPLPNIPIQNSRIFANWYEEGTNYMTFYGAPDKALPGLVIGADRWARTIAYMGGNMLMPTVSIYQMNLFPSKFNINFCDDMSSPDVVRILLLTCEKYGMSFVGEFHPEGRELCFVTDNSLSTDPNRGMLRSKDGQMGHRPGSAAFSPSLSPLYPENQKWYLGMIGEFADRYKDSPAFKGVCLRLMTWANTSLNNFHSLDWGYEDCTVNFFEKETGKKIPVEANDPQRYRKRYEWLMANAREKWISWRCEKVAQIYTAVRNRVRQARADLVVYSDLFSDPTFTSTQALREAGIDVNMLTKINGVCMVNSMFAYGRQRFDPAVNQFYRDYLTDPVWLNLLDGPRCSAFLSGSMYFEATEVVAIPEDLGFLKGTKRPWMSAVVNPAGRHYLERYAIQLAQTDATFVGDGGNAYTSGQPVLREWMEEYRCLPPDRFESRNDALDPVALRQLKRKDGNLYYTVSTEAYPITVECSFNRSGRITSLLTGKELPMTGKTLKLKLAPYQLITFKSPANMKLDRVKTIVPKEQVDKVTQQIDWLNTLLKDVKTSRIAMGLKPDQAAYLTDITKELNGQLKQSHFWRIRTALEHHRMLEIYKICNRYPPAFRDNGMPIAPEGSLKVDDLLKNAQGNNIAVLDSGTIVMDWSNEKVLTSADGKLDITLDIPVDGSYNISFSHAFGGKYERLDATINNQTFSFTATASKPTIGAVSMIPEPVSLKKGKATIHLKGSAIAVSYVMLNPNFRDICADEWMVLGPFSTGAASRYVTNAADLVNYAMRSVDFGAEVKRDFDAAVPLENGTRLHWHKIKSTSDFVDLELASSTKFGSIHYAVTHIYAPEPTSIRLSYGVDYWIMIWLNSQIMQDLIHPAGHVSKGTFTSDVQLKQGWNELMVKVASGSVHNGFWMAITNPGTLKVSAKKP